MNIGHSDVRELKVTKKWETTKPLPGAITVNLYRTVSGGDQTPVLVGSETMTPDKEGNWNLTFTNLPTQDNSGKTYEYSVEEADAGDYVSVVEGNMDDGFTITNKDREQPKVREEKTTGSLKLTKISVGHETPEDAEFTITGPGNYRKVIRYSEFTNGEFTLNGLAAGTYSIEESNAEVEDYSWTVTGTDSAEVRSSSANPAGITLTNHYEPNGEIGTPDEPTPEPSATPTPEPSDTPAPGPSVTPTPGPSDTPRLGSSDTPTPKPSGTSQTKTVAAHGVETPEAQKTLTSDAPKTGDTVNVLIFILAFIAAGVILTAVLVYRKKRK